MPKYYIKTYGCQMNLADSENLAGVLTSAGYQEANSPEEADILLVNTCVVRQSAEDKAAWYIMSAKGLRDNKPDLIIGVCGCLATEPDRDLPKQFPHVDLFIAPNQPERLIEFLELQAEGQRPKARGKGVTAWITIMHGCDNFCSYCVVPHVRGRETSRPIDEIIKEIKEIDFKKHPEIFLLGQNVNSYKYGLAQLLREVDALLEPTTKPFGKLRAAPSEVEVRRGSRSEEPRRSVSGSERIRFMTSHPRDMSEEIINAVAELPHVCEFFHLPLQHGDDEMLKSMNRGYNTDYYLKLVDKIRAKIPGAAITSDVIVGYPGETDEQFQNTLKMIEKVGFDTSNTLAYSTRPGTAASKLNDDVPDKVKQARLQEAMKVVGKVAERKNQELVGQEVEILVDYTGKKSCSGRTRTNKIVKFVPARNNLLGKLVSVTIKSAKSWVLEGEIINGKF
ncbi:MAG: tRNA (N6-isopentenyl adenosine(37)-C2)-methylthiotransferase MiaB [Candidatus Margulisiibacteriota bacterium]